MSNGYSHSRPVGVTILVVLLWIEALFALVGGVFLMIENDDPDLIRHVGESSDTIFGYGLGLTILGVITAMVAAGLGRGGGFARGFAGVITFIHLCGGVYSLFALDGVTKGSAAVTILISGVILYILFGEKGSQEFFSRSR